VPTRKYDQKLRADQAAQTRRRILDAVADSVREAPTEPVSLDKVAAAAGVARSTIYVVFGSKAGLFDAFTTDLWEGSGLAELQAAVADPDVRRHLRDGIRAGCRMMATDRDLYRVLFSMAEIDPDSVGGAVHKKEENRRGGMLHLARRLAKEGVLRDDVSTRQAARLMWVLTSFESFDLLYTGQRMSVDASADLLATTAERALYR
jgi:AcrR family transcriptional regulator